MTKIATWKLRFIPLGCVLLLLVAVLLLGSSSRSIQTTYYGSSPEEAFELLFTTQPFVAFPCGEHYHMYGLDEGTYDGKVHDSVVSAIVSKSEKGWYVSEKAKLQSMIWGRDSWGILSVYRTMDCNKRLLCIQMNTQNGEQGPDMARRFRDSLGTEFTVRADYPETLGEIFFSAYGLVDVESEGYKLFYDDECIYSQEDEEHFFSITN